jgi:hypothetical protein
LKLSSALALGPDFTSLSARRLRRLSVTARFFLKQNKKPRRAANPNSRFTPAPSENLFNISILTDFPSEFWVRRGKAKRDAKSAKKTAKLRR